MKRNDQMEKSKAAAAKKVALETTTMTQSVTKTTTREEDASNTTAAADGTDPLTSATTKPAAAAAAVQEPPRFDPLEVIDLMSDDDEDGDEDEDMVDKEALADAVVAVLEKKASASPVKEVPETQQVAAPLPKEVARDEDKIVWWNEAKNSSHMQAEAGHKVVVLLHLLVEASKLQEKTVVFVNCIPVSVYLVILKSLTLLI